MAVLYPHFIGMVLRLGLLDLDAAALKDARPRELTQTVADCIYERKDLDGVPFASRHGDELRLWAIIEQPCNPSRRTLPYVDERSIIGV